ncbi:hypothetical protein H0H92_013448 [Tricholoma furcatifolium]|nr:hypothetical protein H0H92_013448 [Tricholoma furcatifolium]
MASADDVQRIFLQAIFSRAVVSTKLAQILWEKSIEAVNAANPELNLPIYTDNDSWQLFVSKINMSIDSLDLEFRHLHDENTGKEMYALVNRKGDEIAQLATDYNAAEIAFFKAIIELIIMAPRESFSVSSTAALREISAIKPKTNMSKTQAEVVLGSFVAKGWLVKSKRGRYSLSTRSLLELLPYLKSNYPEELLECTICMEILTRGVACPTNNCKTRLHYHCFTTYRRRQSTCPSCKTQWPNNHSDKPLIPVGEGAAREGDDAKRWARNIASDEEDEEEPILDDDDDDETRATQSQSQSQPKTRTQRARKSKIVDESMDVDEDEDAEEDEDQPVKKEKPRRSARK